MIKTYIGVLIIFLEGLHKRPFKCLQLELKKPDCQHNIFEIPNSIFNCNPIDLRWLPLQNDFHLMDKPWCMDTVYDIKQQRSPNY